jgi:hypothetical protein
MERKRVKKMKASTVLTVILTVAILLPMSPGLFAGEKPAGQTVVIEGKFIRRAVTEEGVVVVGFKTATFSVGEQWLLLEIAMTTRSGHEATIARDAVTLTDPSGSTFPLASQEAFRGGDGKIRSLDKRANMQRDKLNYLPAEANLTVRLGFFADPSNRVRGLLRDEIQLVPSQGAFGRFYFLIPEGIQYGDHLLNVPFKESVIQVPFRIMTGDEQKEFSKLWKQMQKDEKARKKEEKKARKQENKG